MASPLSTSGLPETAQPAWQNSPLFEIARVLVRVDHVVRFIANANHGIRGGEH